MKKDDKIVTVPDTPAATGEGQSPSLKTKISITDEDTEINNNFDLEKERLMLKRMSAPDYLHTISHSELYDTVFQPRVYLIDGLLAPEHSFSLERRR